MKKKASPKVSATAKTAAPAADTAVIRQLTIERFRGIKALKWNPAPGLNVILGGGDVGKSTILDAIALLLNPSNAAVVSESDYHCRDSNSGFLIQAVLSLPSSTEIGQQQKFIWPWEWNGEEALVPVVADRDPGDTLSPEIPVYRLQVRGTPDMELVWEIVQPNDEIDILSSAVRRAIGVVRLASDDRNDRDLRLVYGSALDRLLADQGLKARIGKQISEIDLNEELSEDAKKSLKRLDDALREGLLPSGLELGLTSAQGISIGALIQELARCILDEPNHIGVAKCLKRLNGLVEAKTDGFTDVCIDYRNEFRDAIKLERFAAPEEGLSEIGRRRSFAHPMPPPKCISTIHKAKGLECDNALVIPCDAKHFSSTDAARCKLYVALSRARRRLTLVVSQASPSPVLKIS